MANQKQVHSTSGIALIRKLDPIFTSEQAKELAPTVGISLDYLNQALHHLERAGWIVRLKKGLYSLSSILPGVSPLHEFQIAMALVRPAAISHWSALNYHGMTEQTPKQVFVLTTAQSLPRTRGIKATPNKRGYHVSHSTFQFIKIKSAHFFGIEEVWINESKVKITDKERTFLDCLMFPEYCGGFYEILYAFEQHSAQLNIEKIIQYARKLDAATIKRLGWILEQQGIPSLKLKPLQETPIKGYRLLDPSGPHKGVCNARWMIQENLPGRKKS